MSSGTGWQSGTGRMRGKLDPRGLEKEAEAYVKSKGRLETSAVWAPAQVRAYLRDIKLIAGRFGFLNGKVGSSNYNEYIDQQLGLIIRNLLSDNAKRAVDGRVGKVAENVTATKVEAVLFQAVHEAAPFYRVLRHFFASSPYRGKGARQLTKDELEQVKTDLNIFFLQLEELMHNWLSTHPDALGKEWNRQDRLSGVMERQDENLC